MTARSPSSSTTGARTSASRSRPARTTRSRSSTTRSPTGRNNLADMRFIAVGELLVDVLAAGSGHDALIRLGPAGSAFNAAVAAAAAGADATAIGTVGSDAAGGMIL